MILKIGLYLQTRKSFIALATGTKNWIHIWLYPAPAYTDASDYLATKPDAH